MSLITDALGLRQGRSEKKITLQEKIPPLPKPPGQGREIQAIGLTLVLMALGVFGILRGDQIYKWIEELVGIGISFQTVPVTPAVSAPVVPALAASPPAEIVTQPEILLTTTPKDKAPIEKGKSVAESSGRLSGVPANGTAPAAEPGKMVKKLSDVGAVESSVDSGVLHSVSVESIEKIKSTDPKFLEQERRNRVENFLLNLRVQGVRIHGLESRIMVDGALIGVGEAIGDFGLRLKSVDSGRLIFVDSEGQEYPKSY